MRSLENAFAGGSGHGLNKLEYVATQLLAGMCARKTVDMYEGPRRAVTMAMALLNEVEEVEEELLRPCGSR